MKEMIGRDKNTFISVEFLYVTCSGKPCFDSFSTVIR